MKQPPNSGLTKRKYAPMRYSYYVPQCPLDLSLTIEHARPRLKGGMPEPERHVHLTSHEFAQQLAQQSPEAQALEEIALAFCQECLGWKNARSINDWGYPYVSESVTKKLADTPIPPYERQFHYSHLDKVMAAVRAWLKPDGIVPTHQAGVFVDVIHTLFDNYCYGTLDDRGLCRELMAACVAANRDQYKNRTFS